MNIFVLDLDPAKAAQSLCDKHVGKMLLESVQIMSTVLGGGEGLYKPTHINHPCVLWTSKSRTNFYWLSLHADALAAEYQFRYGKAHKSEEVLINILSRPWNVDWACGGSTPFAQCMPEQYKGRSAMLAYRRYYWAEKQRFARWEKGRPAPRWWTNMKGANHGTTQISTS